MNKTNLKLCIAFMFTLILMPQAVHAESDPKQGQYSFFSEDSYTRISRNLMFSLGYIGFLAACEYSEKKTLISEKNLVKIDYPYAQRWYHDIAKKYPQAHLETKMFLQSNTMGSSGTSIYFPRSILVFIDSCYQRKMAGALLNAKEEEFLAEQGFYILREAGYLERNDTLQKYVTLACLALANEAVSYGLNNMIQDTTKQYDNQNDFDKALADYNFNSHCIWLATTIASTLAYDYFKNQQHKNANAYAFNIIDAQACNTQPKNNTK